MKNIKAIIFDAYGTLFDVNSAAEKCKNKIGDKWEPFANFWRTTQLEYTWLRSLMSRHKDFWQITEDSLDKSMKAYKIDSSLKDELLNLYKVLSPFEEVQETYSSFLCFSCGYMSDSRYQLDSLKLIDNLKKSPKLVQETKFEDKERNIVWFLSVINMGTLGMIYPEGTPNNFVWRYAKLADVPEGQEENYKGHKQFLDVENAEIFNSKEFLKACESMGITQRLNNA